MAQNAAALDALLRRVSGGGAPAPADLTALERQIAADPATAVLRAADLEPVGAQGRAELLRRVAGWAPHLELEVAGHRVQAVIEPAELWRFYLPIAQGLLAKAQGRVGRVVAGVTGPGAAGKSVFALIVQGLLDALGCRAAVCPQDGFHYPNAYLDSHTILDAQGRLAPLRTVKGAPPSYDLDGFLDVLRGIRAGQAVEAPRYDRRLHDPVPGGIRIGPEHRVVRVEGNDLLLEEGRWAEGAALLDLSIFLEQPMEAAREAMVRRFVAGGRTEQDARARYDQVDRANYELIVTTAGRADLIVERTADQRIRALRRGFDSARPL